MRLYLTESHPRSVVLEDFGFHLVFLPTHETFDEPIISVAAYPPDQEYPLGEREVIPDLAGCLGLIRFEGRNLLILLELPLESVGLEEEVRRIEHVCFFDLDEQRPISLSLSPLDHLLESGTYYISKTLDLAKRVEDRINDDRQRAEACQPRSRTDSSSATPPCPHHFGLPRYVWNSHLLQPLFDLRESLNDHEKAWFDSRSFALPIIEGFYEQKRVNLANGDRVTLTVVSRHGRDRDGTRFEKRGIDSSGNVAQFVETETIVETDTKTISFVQVRGSIPLYWSEKPSATSVNVKIVQPVSLSLSPFLDHIRTLIARFGRVHALSLIHNHDTLRPHPEQPLSDAYEELSTRALSENDLRETFSYQQHSVFSRKKLPDLPQGIVDAVSTLIDEVGVTSATLDKETGKLVLDKAQNGIFRVNCRDCCDRTTLGQWSIAVAAIRRALKSLDVDEDGQARLAKGLGQLWADNGDAVSTIYTGARALFTLFIRTGHYSAAEQAFENFESNERRLVQHYTRDKEKNKAMEILTGEWKEQEAPPKIVLISHPVHARLTGLPTCHASPPTPLSILPTQSVHVIHEPSTPPSPSLSDVEISTKASVSCFQKEKGSSVSPF